MRLSAKIETITPATAAAYLRQMTANRKPKDATVAMYANDMANGKWVISPQAIAFDDQGKLFDGQHRLMAIVRCGIPIPMLVLRGFPAVQQNGRTMDAIDCGAMRSISDRLKLMGAYDGNPNLACAVARQIAKIVMGPNNRSCQKLSLSAVLAIIGWWKNPLSAVMKVTDNPKYKPFRNAHSIAAFTLAAVADAARLDKDMAKLFSGAGLDESSPILALRNTVLLGDDGDRREKAILVLSALHSAWTGGKNRTFEKPEARAAAIAFFRSKQETKFAKVENLFRSAANS
jgi:hypothetical protein